MRDGKVRSMVPKSHCLFKSPLERCEERAKSLANALYDGCEEGFHPFCSEKEMISDGRKLTLQQGTCWSLVLVLEKGLVVVEAAAAAAAAELCCGLRVGW